MDFLCTGIRFDKKRFQKDLEVFQKLKEIEVEQIVEEETFDLTNEQQVQQFKRKHHIKIKGENAPAPISSFSDLYSRYQIPKFLQQNLHKLNFNQPTAIQMASIPILLEGKDLMACAPTGSGKTLSFLIPLITKLSQNIENHSQIKACILSPSRELAQQIYRMFQPLAGNKLKVVLLSKSNVSNPDKKIDLLISTPLRLSKAIKEEKIDLSSVEHLVFDEADKLFEMGFLEQTDEILTACSNEKIQKSLFTATLDTKVETMAASVMRDPIRIIIGVKNKVSQDIQQKLIYCGQEDGKWMAFKQMLVQGISPPVLIFVETVEKAKSLYQQMILNFDHLKIDTIHSERTLAQRDEAIKNFRSGETWILITTELLGRGLDFKGVQMVVNYDMPRSVASYIHRIGRTGRAGKKGEAITFFLKEETNYLRKVANVMRMSGCDVPEWMLKLKEKKHFSKKQEKNE